MKPLFRIGVTPDFYRDAKGRFESVLERELGPAEGVEYEPMPPQPDDVATPEALERYDGIFALGLRITRESVQGVRRTAVVARWGVGYDRIDVAALTEAGIALAITPGAVKRPVAEAILALIFALSKNLLVQDRTVREGGWRGDLPGLGADLAGSVLGSVGCGNIAREMFRMAVGLGFRRRIACDPYVPPETAAELGVELVPMETVFRESDYVAVNVPLNERTRGMIGAEHFRLMKPAAFFINTARGAIVREPDLVRALEEGWIRGAGLDVFEREPLPAGHPLTKLRNVVLAPHALAWTQGLVRDNGVEACRNLLAVARGDPPPGLVNREVLENPAFQAKLDRYRGEG